MKHKSDIKQVVEQWYINQRGELIKIYDGCFLKIDGFISYPHCIMEITQIIK